MFLPLSLSLLACGGDALLPSTTFDQNPLVAELPADATLVAGVRIEPLRASPRVWGWVDAAGVDVPGAEDELERRYGLTAGIESVDHLAAGCDARGCLGVVEGELDGLALGRLARRARARLGARELTLHRRARTPLPGIDARLPDGQSGSLRLLDDRRALLGHADAVQARLGDPESSFDPLTLAGAVPAGELWVAARDQETMAAQIETWLSELGTESADRQRERLQTALSLRGDAARSVQVIAASVQLAGTPTAAVRLTFDDPGPARIARAALSARLGAERLRERDPFSAQILDAVEVIRVDHQVEVRCVDADGALSDAFSQRLASLRDGAHR